MSRNALFKHLDEKHRFCRKWQQQSEAEEKTSPHACNGSHTNPCPAASPWQIQRISVVSKRSHALASKTTRLPHVNGFAALYEPDEHGCGFLTGDDQIDSFAVFWEQDKAAIAPPSPRYTFPRAASTRVVVVGTTVHHSDSVECISAQHKHIYIEPTRLYYLPICMTNIKIICHIQWRVFTQWVCQM